MITSDNFKLKIYFQLELPWMPLAFPVQFSVLFKSLCDPALLPVWVPKKNISGTQEKKTSDTQGKLEQNFVKNVLL